MLMMRGYHVPPLWPWMKRVLIHSRQVNKFIAEQEEENSSSEEGQREEVVLPL